MSKQSKESLHQFERVQTNIIDVNQNSSKKKSVLEISNLLCDLTSPLQSPKSDAFFNESQTSSYHHYLNTCSSPPSSSYQHNSKPFNYEKSIASTDHHQNQGESIFYKSPRMSYYDQAISPLSSLSDLQSKATDQKDRSRLLLPLPSINFHPELSKPWNQTQHLENRPIESQNYICHPMMKLSSSSSLNERHSFDSSMLNPIRNSKQEPERESRHVYSTRSCTIPLEVALHAQIQRHRQLCWPYSNTNRGEVVKPKRKRANADQLKILNQVFQQTLFPTTELRIQLGRQLGMSPRTVQIWFQNKRQSLRGRPPTGISTSINNKDDNDNASNGGGDDDDDGNDSCVTSSRSTVSS